MGADGFVARLTADRKLIWALFFADSNPFDQIQVRGNVATCHSTAEFELAVDIDDPPRNRSPPGQRQSSGCPCIHWLIRSRVPISRLRCSKTNSANQPPLAGLKERPQHVRNGRCKKK